MVVASAGDPSSTMQPCRTTDALAVASIVVLASIEVNSLTSTSTEEDTSIEVYLPMEVDAASNDDNETVEEMFEDDESVADFCRHPCGL